jgi:alpha,alpha-trehalase
MQKYLWNKEDGTYYNLDTTTGEHIKVRSYSNYWALFGKIATKEQASSMISYLWDPKHMLTKYGLRTLSKTDPHYNNVFMLKPHSNWQGPVWPIANYIMFQGLLNYGYQKEALEVATRVSKLVLNDIDKTGGMHECYNAETGEPLAAPNFVSWNVLVYNMIDEAEQAYNPFSI